MIDYDSDGTYWPALDSDIKNGYYMSTDMIQQCTIPQIEYSEWTCHITSNFTIVPLKGDEPNWFWRKMHYLVFGFKWCKK